MTDLCSSLDTPTFEFVLKQIFLRDKIFFAIKQFQTFMEKKFWKKPKNQKTKQNKKTTTLK